MTNKEKTTSLNPEEFPNPNSIPHDYNFIHLKMFAVADFYDIQSI